MSRNTGSLRFTKGMPAIPLRHPRSPQGERATVAPRGWLHVTALTQTSERRLSSVSIDSLPAEVCEME